MPLRFQHVCNYSQAFWTFNASHRKWDIHILWLNEKNWRKCTKLLVNRQLLHKCYLPSVFPFSFYQLIQSRACEALSLMSQALLPALLEAAFGGSGVSQHQPNTALKEEQNWSWHSSTTDLTAQLLSHLSLTSLTSRELLSSDIKCMLHSWVPHRSQLLGEPWR